jgi:hypothetical protein
LSFPEELVDALIDDLVFENENLEVDALASTIDLLQDVGIDIVDYGVSEDDNIVLESAINGTDSTINIIEATDESVIMNVEEGNLSDTLELKDDGTAWLNGKELKVIDEFIESDDSVIANAKHIYRTTSSCPYGKAADYTKKGGTYTRSYQFEKKVENVTRGVLLIALGV